MQKLTWSLFAVVSLLVPAFVSAASTARGDYEQILLPMITIPVRIGANGTLWSAEFVGRNNGGTDVDAFQLFDAVACTDCGFKPIPPHTDFHVRPTLDGYNPVNAGIFIYVQKSAASSLSYSLRLRENSRHAEEFIELPIVHESQFASETMSFLAVPRASTSRVHLRVYGVSSPSGDGVVAVRIYDGATLVSEKQLTLTPGRGAALLATETMFPTNPAYAELVNLMSAPPLVNGDPVRVEVVPVTPGLRFWSFISVTNNSTERVSLITAQ